MTLPKLGLHEGVDEAEYHADPLSLSSSSAKKVIFSGPDEYVRQKLEGPQYNEAFDFGSVVHALILGVGEYEVLDFDSWRTKAARAARDEVRARGAAPIIPRDFAKAEAMRDSVLDHPEAARILSEGRPELSLWATDPATGVLMRGRIDWLRGGLNCDVKTTSGQVTRDAFIDTVMRFNYGFQAAFYSRLLWLNGIEPDRPAWIAVSKRAPHDAEVFRPSADLIESSIADVDRALELYARCVESNTWPSLEEAGVAADPLGYIAHSETLEVAGGDTVVPT